MRAVKNNSLSAKLTRAYETFDCINDIWMDEKNQKISVQVLKANMYILRISVCLLNVKT